MALAAAENGKHVLCEKPLGLNAQQVRQMYRAAEDAQLVHMTAFTYRFAPSMRYLKHLLESGALGTPRHFRSELASQRASEMNSPQPTRQARIRHS